MEVTETIPLYSQHTAVLFEIPEGKKQGFYPYVMKQIAWLYRPRGFHEGKEIKLV